MTLSLPAGDVDPSRRRKQYWPKLHLSHRQTATVTVTP